MIKKVLISCGIIVVLLLNLFAFNSLAAVNVSDYDSIEVSKILEKTNVFELKAKSSILMDVTSGNIILETNSHARLPIASITKIMSMLLVMEAIDSGKIKLNDMVTVSEHTYNMGGSQVYLKPGEEFSVNEMLKAVAIHSANDATVALAEKVSGSEETFVVKMNEKAKELGMNDTNFIDCTGLTDDGHYSSAYDIALMSRELIKKHPNILDFTSIWHDTFRSGIFSLDNTNKLIKFYNGANGLKTGFTTKAGHCLTATAKKNDMQLISVVLGEADSNTRFAEARKMLDYGFANFEIYQINSKGEEAGLVTVKKGLTITVKGIFKENVKLLIKRGEKGIIDKKVILEQSITAPVKEGQKIGEIIYEIDKKEVGKADIIAESKVDKASFTRLFFRMIKEWFGIDRK